MLLLQLLLQIHSTWAMEEAERLELRLEASDMFYHAYNAYMERAWPADELMPLSCRGRYRGREPSRGDIDEALGNFSLTLIDSLDMLVVLGDIKEFEAAVEKVVNTVSFDTDVVVSVFETNIRIVGGLVSAHILAELVREREGVLEWYRGQLLNMAVDVANRLLPAFNSTTGLPYPRVNLRTGLEGVNTIQLTCTACAGSMILEFAALSRLSGEKIFEEKASRAMDVLWAARHRQSNLVGNVLNVNTGDWVRRDSGVGAGIDSYYEYVAKAYVLLGEEKYLERWNTHYSAVMKYLGSGPLMMDVHMHRPTTNSKHFADALGAFWPGLQVLMGDLKPAIEQHEVLYQITKRHHFLPEAVTSDFQVHWGQHLLRPEFVESTYFLYKATRDPHYLEVGKKVLKALQKHARVTCGYAAVKDVRTLQHEDRMDSFVLSETLKYLYLLFAKPEDLYLDIEQFVFTTEAHLLPLSLARLSNTTAVPLREEQEEVEDEEVEFAQACPSTRYMFPGHDSAAKAAASVRQPLGNIVEDSCPKQKVINRRLLAAEFQSGNPQHIQLLKDMGISIVTMADGRVQLLHTFASAASQEDAEEGLYFMQDMIDLSKQQTSLVDSPPKQVGFVGQDGKEKLLQAGPAQFGPELKNGFKVNGKLMVARDRKSCEGSNSQEDKDSLIGNIVLVERGDCMFIEKGRVLQGLGARGGIVIDTAVGSAAATSPLFAMSGDGSNDVNIPMVFLFHAEATLLLEALKADPQLEVSLEEKPEISSTDSVGEGELEGGRGEDEEDAEELVLKLRSPVHQFLQKNLQAESGGSGLAADSLLIQLNPESGELVSEAVHTLRGPDGASRTYKTVERLHQNGEVQRSEAVGEVVRVVRIQEQLQVETLDEASIPDSLAAINNSEVAEDELVPTEWEEAEPMPQVLGELQNTEASLEALAVKSLAELGDQLPVVDQKAIEVEAKEKLFSDLTGFFNPESREIQDIILDTSEERPDVITQILSIPFSELLEAFQLLLLESTSLADTYRTLFDRVDTLGREPFIAAMKERRRALSAASGAASQSSGEDVGTVERLVGRVVRQLLEVDEKPAGGLAAVLGGDARVGALLQEYLADIPSQQRRHLVQVTSLLQLIIQETLESVIRARTEVSGDTKEESSSISSRSAVVP